MRSGCHIGATLKPQPILQLLRHVREMHRHHQQVGDDLVALVLEVVLGEPERVEAAVVELLGDRLGLLEHRRQLLVRVAPLVGRRRVLAHVGKIDVAGIDGDEFA